MNLLERMRNILRFRWRPFTVVTLAVSFLIVFCLRSRIAENKFTQAKLEIVKTLMSGDEEDKKARIIEIIDSTFVNRDTSETL